MLLAYNRLKNEALDRSLKTKRTVNSVSTNPGILTFVEVRRVVEREEKDLEGVDEKVKHLERLEHSKILTLQEAQEGKKYRL
jgi:hypothetical protein